MSSGINFEWSIRPEPKWTRSLTRSKARSEKKTFEHVRAELHSPENGVVPQKAVLFWKKLGSEQQKIGRNIRKRFSIFHELNKSQKSKGSTGRDTFASSYCTHLVVKVTSWVRIEQVHELETSEIVGQYPCWHQKTKIRRTFSSVTSGKTSWSWADESAVLFRCSSLHITYNPDAINIMRSATTTSSNTPIASILLMLGLTLSELWSWRCPVDKRMQHKTSLITLISRSCIITICVASSKKWVLSRKWRVQSRSNQVVCCNMTTIASTPTGPALGDVFAHVRRHIVTKKESGRQAGPPA